jgi:hypothetical protein
VISEQDIGNHGERLLQRAVGDPDSQPIELVRAIRDDIAQRVQMLVDALVPAANA